VAGVKILGSRPRGTTRVHATTMPLPSKDWLSHGEDRRTQSHLELINRYRSSLRGLGEEANDAEPMIGSNLPGLGQSIVRPPSQQPSRRIPRRMTGCIA
jgi:hypothetical protein